jgi:hypothetical protein
MTPTSDIPLSNSAILSAVKYNGEWKITGTSQLKSLEGGERVTLIALGEVLKMLRDISPGSLVTIQVMLTLSPREN